MPVRSIRQHLLQWLVVPMTMVLIVGAFGDYLVALEPANRAYDEELLNIALAIFGQLTKDSNHIGIDFPPSAERVLMRDQYDQTYFSVRGQNRKLIAGEGDLPPPPPRNEWEGHLNYDGVFRGKSVRVVALYLPYQGSRILIQAAQTIVKRQRLAREILVEMLVPEVLMAVATLALVWLGVGKGLRPLIDVRTNLAGRSDSDLQPIPEAAAPAEIRPMLHALNGFLTRLRRSLDAQKTFISNAAHQLRTPLAALQSQVEFGLRQQDPGAWRQTLEKVHVGTRRTARIANQLLTLARAEPGVLRDGALQPVDLRALVQGVVAEWINGTLAMAKDLGFELQPAHVVGDPVLLRELLSNLVDNAIKYTGPNGRITVRTMLVEGKTILQVEDDGPGIAADERERVFDRFYRIEGTMGEGCGLGLSIVREIAAAHGATLSLFCGTTGSGTCITVTFPG